MGKSDTSASGAGRTAKTPLIRRLRVTTGGALLGSVLSGTFLHWIPLEIDVRIVGAIIFGALAGYGQFRKNKMAST